MILGFTPFTFFHVVLSLLGIASGFVVLAGMMHDRRQNGLTLFFLATTVATNATGFGFPFFRVLPSHIIAVLSFLVLALALVGRYVRHLNGPWRWIYAVGVVLAQYFNVFILVVQLFRRVPALYDLAPTQSEPPFQIVQVVVLLAFVWLGIRVVKRFRPATEAPAPARP